MNYKDVIHGRSDQEIGIKKNIGRSKIFTRRK